MAIHELATNAVKYGALGQPAGRLTVSWSVLPCAHESGQLLQIDWLETGVLIRALEAVEPRKGHGRELLEQALPHQLGAQTTYTLAREGLHCTITVPIVSSASDRALPAGRRTHDPQGAPIFDYLVVPIHAA